MTTAELRTLTCRSREGEAPLDDASVHLLLTQANGWALDGTGPAIERTFRFADFYETMAFVNALAFVAHQQDHHPEMKVGYNSCTVRFSTHSVKGLSENDFICAARTNALLEE